MTIKENSHMGTEISRADTLPLTYKLLPTPQESQHLGFRGSQISEFETSLVSTQQALDQPKLHGEIH